MISMRFVGLCLCVCAGSAAMAQTTNSWTNALSGNWQNPYWSLGILPGPGQEVDITNPGFKTVTISSSTRDTAPGSLNVSRIVLGSPANSFNQLLLDSVGSDIPVTAVGMVISSNSALVALDSQLQVGASTGESLHVGGTVAQGNNAQISARQAFIGDVGPGVYYLTNGSFSVYRANLVLGTTNFWGPVQPDG